MRAFSLAVEWHASFKQYGNDDVAGLQRYEAHPPGRTGADKDVLEDLAALKSEVADLIRSHVVEDRGRA